MLECCAYCNATKACSPTLCYFVDHTNIRHMPKRRANRTYSIVSPLVRTTSGQLHASRLYGVLMNAQEKYPLSMVL